jgi:hypothetical protein
MSRVYSDPEPGTEEQPELDLSGGAAEAVDRHDAPRAAGERSAAARSARASEPARSEFFRAKRRPLLPLIGLAGAAGTIAFFLWLGRDGGSPAEAPPAGELAPVAAAPDFEVPLPTAPAAASPDSLAEAPEPDPSVAPPGPGQIEPPAAPAPVQVAAAAPTLAPEPPRPAAAPKREAGTPRAASGAFSVQLLAARSESDVGASWSRLRGAHPDLLASLSPTVARMDRAPGDTFYRLRAGPLPDRPAADALCRALSARQQACFVVSPGS